MRSLLIAAPSSGQGKTTLTLGLLRALVRRGVDVCSAKSGPDFIDPAFHAAATGRACLTLDPWAALPSQQLARARTANADLMVIEGAMGLWDGAATEESIGTGSCAALANTLHSPVVMVVDVSRMGQSVAPLLQGYARFDPGVRIAGVILNRVGSARHEALTRRAAETVCPVLGCLPRDDALMTPSRHLGLVQAGERTDLEAFIEAAADRVAQSCDVPEIAAMAQEIPSASTPSARLPPLGQRVAVARDLAFSFVYEHLLMDWRAQGVDLSFFSPLADEAPDAAADAVYLPGGYPELHAARLAAADQFRGGMIAAARAGRTIYGECGGYMVLGQTLVDADGAGHPMLGLLPVETSFADRKRTLGYRKVTISDGPLSGAYRAHEFHYTTETSAPGEPLGHASDAAGTVLGPVGRRIGSVSGSYMHLIERA